jgi:hypothetical protein
MSFDETVLKVQRAIDRGVRRFRRGAPPLRAERRLLIIQIDGLSRSVLEHALTSHRMPFLSRLLKRHGYRVEPMAVGLPTSTPAFQMAAMYGVHPDIPGFHYYDRDRGADIHFPRPGHAAYVQRKLAADRQGILTGGSAYGCVFTGGADNDLFSFATLTRPSGRGILAGLSPFVVVAWVFGKNVVLTSKEFAKAVGRFLINPQRARQGWRWLTIKIGMSIWVRGFFTMAVARDLYAGVPAVYVNYLEYDVSAHAFGPRSRCALQSLRSVDRAIHQLWSVLQRVPEHRYDLYILADHGQAGCTPYRDLCDGRRLERWIFDAFLKPAQDQPPERHAPNGLIRGIRARRRGSTAMLQKFLNYVEEDFLRHEDPEAYERDGVRVISAGPNAFFYVVDATEPLDIDGIEVRFPGLPQAISRSPGVGFVLARSAAGPLCFWRGEQYRLSAREPGPFKGRDDLDLVVDSIAGLMRMPSAGDLVIYGTGLAERQVSFIPEHGAHAGPSHDEMHTFIVRGADVTLPLPINHPAQLYDHFMRYQSV